MRTNSAISLIYLLLASLMSASAAGAELRNRLAGSASPYLAMHAQDPTAWQNWSKETVELARKQGKPLFVSVGYFSCHWCHVMQRESYRNPEIADYINRHYIPVKVDRETEPALDAYLIGFAGRTQGYSGWPLNVFMSPEGYPMYATVYLPPKEFLQLLQKMQSLWSQSPGELSRLAAEAQPHGNGPGKPVSQAKLGKTLGIKVEQLALQLGAPLTGGFGEANKFPLAPQLDFLLNRVSAGGDSSLRDFVGLTLDNMARYGLRDHLGGGFFRYTVDPGWRTPHFEKMLYDNALLASIYMKASRVYRNDEYRHIARETLDFMQSEMFDRRGAMIASFSAIDQRNVEGGYYLWRKDELKKLLTSDEWRAYRLYAGMTDPSPLEDGYLPMPVMTAKDIGRQLQMQEQEVRALVRSSNKKLLERRSERTLLRDDKLLAGWNGLALSAFSTAAERFADKGYARTAGRIRDYLLTTLWDGRRLLRAGDQGRPLGQASLEDYAYVAKGLLDWARLTGKTEDYQQARTVVHQAWSRFYGDHGWRLSEAGFIPMEPPVDVISDGPMPSPSAVVVDVSLQLADKLQDRKLRRQALAAANSGQALVQADPFWYVSQIQSISR